MYVLCVYYAIHIANQMPHTCCGNRLAVSHSYEGANKQT